MGQFSWITQDTDEPIRECFGCRDEKLTTAYMHDNKGNVWEEKSYEGYGVFGGKDFYELLAEMNGVTISQEKIDKEFAKGFNETKEETRTDLIRIKGIRLAFDESKDEVIQPNLTRRKTWQWINESPENDPNQGWGDDGIEVIE